MFSILQITYSKSFFNHKKVQISKRKVNDKYYYIIKARSYHDAVNWKKVSAMAGSTAGYILASEKTFLPKPLCRYNSRDFERTVLYNSFLGLLTKCNQNNLNIGVIDISARFCDKIAPLLGHAATVTILTGEDEVYNDFSERCFSRYGISPIITGNPLLLKTCTVVLAPYCQDEDFRNINDYTFGRNGYNIDKNEILADGQYLNEKPPDIAALDFLAALYERGNFSELANVESAGFVKNKTPIRACVMAKIISHLT